MRCLSEEEYAVGSRFLFLSMAIVVLKQDIAIIEKGRHKIKKHLLTTLKTMESAALAERKQLRKIMADKQIRITALEKNDAFSVFLFVCGSREEKRNYFNPAIRKKVEDILMELTQTARQSDPPYSSTNA